MRDDRLHITPVELTTPADAEALADRIDAMLPRIRVTELLHEVARDTGFLSAFTNLRTGEARLGDGHSRVMCPGTPASAGDQDVAGQTVRL